MSSWNKWKKNLQINIEEENMAKGNKNTNKGNKNMPFSAFPVIQTPKPKSNGGCKTCGGKKVK